MKSHTLNCFAVYMREIFWNNLSTEENNYWQTDEIYLQKLKNVLLGSSTESCPF